jgi:hypothetical protein
MNILKLLVELPIALLGRPDGIVSVKPVVSIALKMLLI